MDPLAISSGVVGFIAFTVQVAKLVSKTKSAVQQFKSATAEVQDLVDKLVVIETVCMMVEANLGMRQQSLDASPLPLLRPISAGLERCHDKLEGLDRVLSPFMDALKAPSRKRQTLLRIQFFFGRDEIQRLVNGVGEAVAFLQFVMTADTW